MQRAPGSCKHDAYSTYKYMFQRTTPWVQILVLQFAGLSEDKKVTQTLKFGALETLLIIIIIKKGDNGTDFSEILWGLDEMI